MPRRKIVKPSQDEFVRQREELLNKIQHGELSTGEAIRSLRELLGMDQKEFCEKVAKISRKALSKIENNSGDVKVSTLERCCAPFGLQVGLVVRTWPHE